MIPDLIFLSKQTRRRVALVSGIGIFSFFQPLITTGPPVMGRLHWSLFDIVCQLHRGGLHGDSENVWFACLLFGVPYVVFSLFLGGACTNPSLTLFFPVWTIGTVCAFETFRGGQMDLEGIFYGTCCSLQGPVAVWQLSWVLLSLMILLALVIVYQPGSR